jgi:hypothetical protein
LPPRDDKQDGLAARRAASGRRLSPGKRAKIIKALKINPHASQVARQIGGVSHVTVGKIARRAGIKLIAGQAAKGVRRLSPEKRAKIIEALKINSHASQVARQIGGVSHVTVNKIAKQVGLELTDGYAARARWGISPDKRKKINEALKITPNASQVARQIGDVGYETVKWIARGEGIRLGRGGGSR